MNTPDSLQIQRLVDGECDEAELRSMLIETEKQPDGWKKIATAFVEDKFWQTQFQQFGTSCSGSQAAPLSPGEERLPSTVRTQTSSETSFNRFYPRSIRWLTLAASLMLAGMFGYLLGTSPLETATEMGLAAGHHETTPEPVAELASSTAQTPKITPAILKPDYHLQLPESTEDANGVAFESEIPLYYVQSPEQLNQIEEPEHDRFQLAPEQLVQLADRGIQMRQDLNFISGNLKDGRSFMIPVRTINFSPGQ